MIAPVPRAPQHDGVVGERPGPRPVARRARPRWRPVVLLGCVALAALLALPGLGRRPLYSAGEVRVALIARAMVESGDWVQPRFNHVRYYEKPPLLYWSVAAAYEALGFGEFASRLPAALAYVGTVVAVFFLAVELLGPAGAPWAALVFATAPAAFHFGRFVSIDTLLTLFSTLALLGLALATRGDRAAPQPRERRPPPRPPAPLAACALFWLSTALAGMTKGLIGVLFPLVTLGLYALMADRAVVRSMRPGLGALVLGTVFLPWHLALAWRDPSFVPFYVLNEHVYRFFNIRDPIDYDSLSISAFWLAGALWFFPWSLILPAALIWCRCRHHLLIPFLWIVVVMGFFTLSRARLEYYAQPAYPACALVVAGYWLSAGEPGRHWFGLRIPAVVMTLFGISAGALWLVHPEAARGVTRLVSALDGYYREFFDKHPDKAFFFVNQALDLGKLFAAAWLLLGISALTALRVHRPAIALACWIVCLVPTAWGFDRGIRLIAEDRSQRAAARIVQRHWQEGAHLVVAGTFEDAAGVTLYTRLPTLMLDGTGGDLLFGHQQGDAPDLFLTRETFDRLWHSPGRVFLLTQRESRPPEGTVLLEDPRHTLLTNHPGPGLGAAGGRGFGTVARGGG